MILLLCETCFIKTSKVTRQPAGMQLSNISSYQVKMAANTGDTVPEEQTWSNEKVSELIELYESKPCLYKTTDKDYHNRDLRKKAHAEISEMIGFPGRLYQFCHKIH